MMEWFESLESALFGVATLGELLLEFISVGCVLFGVFKTIQFSIKLVRRHVTFPFIQLRTSFGIWLALALEFQLGADILATTIAPSQQTLIQLGAIALIRTFLNYFLNKELEKQIEFQEKAKEKRLPEHPIEA
jgi:uncharacterized membrane protein